MKKIMDIRPDALEDDKCIIKFDIDGNIQEKKLDYNLNSEEIIDYINKYKNILKKSIKKIKRRSSKNTFKRKFITHLCMTPYYLLMLYSTLYFSASASAVGTISLESLSSILAIVGGAMFVHNNAFLHTTPAERRKINSYQKKKREVTSIEYTVKNIISKRKDEEFQSRERENELKKQEEKRKQKLARDEKRQELAEKKRKLEEEKATQEALMKERSKINIERNLKIQKGVRYKLFEEIRKKIMEFNIEINGVLKQIYDYEIEAEKRGISRADMKKNEYYQSLLQKYELLKIQREFLNKQYNETKLLLEENREEINNLKRR